MLVSQKGNKSTFCFYVVCFPSAVPSWRSVAATLHKELAAVWCSLWGNLGSNLQPQVYEASALTAELAYPQIWHFLCKKSSDVSLLSWEFLFGQSKQLHFVSASLI